MFRYHSRRTVLLREKKANDQRIASTDSARTCGIVHGRPGYLAEIQGAINDVAASPLKGTPLFEQFLWALQGVTERLVGDARAVEKETLLSGDDDAILNAKAEVSLLLQCAPSSA